jgi:geranylgeranyl diphosphate synthase type I
VLAEQLLRTCGAAPDRTGAALSRFDRMRAEMAAGQLLDVLGPESGAAPARVAALKTGSYTVEGPVLVASALAGAGEDVEGPLRVYGSLLGEAFQLRDDVLDGDAEPGSAARVGELVGRARAAIEDAPLEPEARDALLEVAASLSLGERR